MNSIIIALILNNIICIAGYIYIREKDNKREEIRFREYVIATKAKKLDEYVQTIPSDEPLPEQKQDEFVELDQIPEEDLLKSLTKQYGINSK